MNSVSSQSSVAAAAPVIIIGAGRSGTNMLRDLLVSQSEFVTWPCDEINYIWRHGNRGFGTDEFTRKMADEKTKAYIRKQFRSLAKKTPGATVLEKTCANSLRCGFVHEIFPHAKFVHIIRDGRDVAASAALRWNAKLDVGYILKKARFVPWSDLPYYASKYFGARVFRIVSGKSRLSTWGPKFDGMREAFTGHDLPVGCAIQWKRCVGLAIQQLAELGSEQVLTIKYEEFTADPAKQLQQVGEFLGVSFGAEKLAELTKRVSNKSVGKWKSQLTDSQVANIDDVAGDMLAQLGYKN